MAGSLVIALIVISILILVHEVGHFIAARKVGVWVEEFGIGIPPRIIGKKVGDTIYSINLLPFGGFVRLHGEHSEEGVTKPQKAFINKDKKARSTVTIAGVIMNFALAVVAFAVVYTHTGIPRESNDVKVIGISKNSPAENAGILADDVIKVVQGEEIVSTNQFVSVVERYKGEEINLVVERGGEEVGVALTPRIEHPEEEGPIGVVITSFESYFPPIWQRPFLGIYYGFREAVFWGGEVAIGIFTVIVNLFRGNVPKGIAGPVGIYAITSQAAKFGIVALINFTGILSVNLAILNIIPFPALDGGRLLFIAIESVFGRKVVPKIEETIHKVGMLILIFILLAITALDIQRLISAGGISQFIETVLK